MSENPTIWLIPRSLDDYHELHGLIAGEPTEKSSRAIGKLPVTTEPDFMKIRKKDKILFYIPGEGLIIDILTVQSNEPRSYFACYSRHVNLLVHSVETSMQLGAGKQLNFRKLIEDSKKSPFKEIKDCSTLDAAAVISKKRYIKINNEELKVIEKSLDNPAYITHWNMNPDRRKIKDSEHLSSLLDFYNTRTTSFANLLVASIFGIAAFSAIIQSLTQIIQASWFFALMSTIPFITIGFAILYTLFSYCYYADIAERIKSTALVGAYYKELNAPRIYIKRKDFLGRSEFTYRNLIDYINEKKKISFDVRLPILICIITLFVLFVMAYWNPLALQDWF